MPVPTNDIYSLDFFETSVVPSPFGLEVADHVTYAVTRVPGGWIFSTNHAQSKAPTQGVFIPYDTEFLGQLPPTVPPNLPL